jgi:hypothetical protein
LESATLSYQTLWQEWQTLMTQEELVMDTSQMYDCIKQMEALKAALEQLVQQPTPNNFITTKVKLAGARSRLRLVFANHAQQYPEQVEAGENQLSLIDQLVRYGETRSKIE